MLKNVLNSAVFYIIIQCGSLWRPYFGRGVFFCHTNNVSFFFILRGVFIMKKVSAFLLALCTFASLVCAGCEDTAIIPPNSSLYYPDSDTESKDGYIEPGDIEDSETGDFEGSYAGENSSNTQNKNEPEYVGFFGEKAVHTLNVEIESKAWNAICASPKAKEYQHADITIDGQTIADCGFKTHGNSTLNMAVEHGNITFPFKIKFDKYTDKDFMGLDELVLCNNEIDASYARQYAGYEAFRAIGKEAPLCTFFNVYINGELLGLYAGVEEIDNSYLKRVFGSKKHNLYKTNEMATLTPNMASWTISQKKGTDTSRSDLKKLIRILDETPKGEKGEIEDILDVDSALVYLAVGAVIHHCDGYAGYSAHNYCLYFDDGVFHMVPWDMDLCFYQTGWGFRPSDGSQMDIKSGLTDDAKLSERPLVEKLLAVDEYYEIYLEYCSKVTEWLKQFNESGADELFALIDESVSNDPRNKYSSFNREFNSEYHYGFAGYIKERAEYLEKRIPEIYEERKANG